MREHSLNANVILCSVLSTLSVFMWFLVLTKTLCIDSSLVSTLGFKEVDQLTQGQIDGKL